MGSDSHSFTQHLDCVVVTSHQETPEILQEMCAGSIWTLYMFYVTLKMDLRSVVDTVG